jgi:nitroimidazol reductase NimA-like FMN-containing flavoprotein (pyridoxamine 5'-phosphate oxidase superfamily)
MSESFAWEIVDKCEYAFLAMTAEDGMPYGLPVTIARQGRSVFLHSAQEGRKASCLRARPRVCLTCVGDTQIQEEQFTTLFESAVAFGTVREITEDSGKTEALRLICQRHTPHNMGQFDEAAARSLARTAIFCIDVDEITGKCKR